MDVYVDVSASCAAYLSELFAAVVACHGLVAPRVFQFACGVEEVSLQALARGEVRTTGGTVGASFTQHLSARRSRAAVVLTDGYVGPIPAAHLDACRRARLQVVLTPRGWERDLAPAAAAIHHLEIA